MRVLVGCEFSGVVRRAFRAAGHDAWSCDILDSLDSSPYHIKGNVLKHLNDGWDLGIFHPPCTYLANSGVRHLFIPNKGVWGLQRAGLMYRGAEFFSRLRDAPIPQVAVENPIPHSYAGDIMGPYDQIIQPWMFGIAETKAICLWLRLLPKLKPTIVMDERDNRVHKKSPGTDRWLRRSIFYPRIAEAMAEQWGNELVGNPFSVLGRTRTGQRGRRSGATRTS